MTGLSGTVLGIPGYLVSRDPWDSTPGGTTRACPGYPGILLVIHVTPRLVGLPGNVLGIPGYFSGSTGLHAWWDYPGMSWVSRDTSRDPRDSTPGGTTRECPGYPGILLGIHGTPRLVGLPRNVVGIPWYLVSQDPRDSMPGGTTWDCLKYTGILSTMGTIWDLLGMWCCGCPMYSGMFRVVLGQPVAVVDIPHLSLIIMLYNFPLDYVNFIGWNGTRQIWIKWDDPPPEAKK